MLKLVFTNQTFTMPFFKKLGTNYEPQEKIK